MPSRDKDIAIRLSLKDGETVRRALMQLGDDGQKALAKIEKQSKPTSKGLLAVNAVSGELKGGMSVLAGRLGAVGAGLGALGPAGFAASVGIGAAVVALTGLVRASVTAATELAAIKDEAQQAGAAVETYQALQYAAEKYSVSQEALTDGLKELNLRADEFVVTGQGSAQEAFLRLGFTQEELQQKLGDTGALFLDVIRRMQGLESEAARIRVADEIFGGTGGEQFVRMVAAGEEAVRSLMREARDLGYVMDESLINRADETRDKMNQLQRLIDLQLNSALVDLAPIALGVAEAFAEVAKWVADVVDGFRDLENQSTRGIERRLEELDQYFAGRSRPNGGHARRQYDANFEERERLQAVLMERQAAANNKPKPSAPGQTGGAKAEADKIRQVTDALRFQADQLTRTEYGKRVYQELQRAGIDGNHREASTIAGLVFQVMEIERAEKQAAKAKQDGAAMTKSVMTAEETRAAALAEINRLLAEGAITEETAARARAEADQTLKQSDAERLRSSRDAADGIKRALMDIRDASTDTAQQWEEDIKGMNQTARSAFVDIALGAKTMSEGLQSVLGDLQKRLVGRIYDRTIGSLFDGMLDGIFGGAGGGVGVVNTPTATLHGGGIVGRDSSGSKRMPVTAFAGARRFHSGGLVSGEVPIIAMRGERVLTEAQQDNTAQTIAGLAALARTSAPGVNVVVNNNAGGGVQARAQVSQGRDGGMNLEIIVEEIENRMVRNVGRGEGMAPTLERRYGLDPAAGARR